MLCCIADDAVWFERQLAHLEGVIRDPDLRIVRCRFQTVERKTLRWKLQNIYDHHKVSQGRCSLGEEEAEAEGCVRDPMEWSPVAGSHLT